MSGPDMYSQDNEEDMEMRFRGANERNSHDDPRKNYGYDHDNNDLFFATEIEANYNKNHTPQPEVSISNEPKIKDGELTSGRDK